MYMYMYVAIWGASRFCLGVIRIANAKNGATALPYICSGERAGALLKNYTQLRKPDLKRW